MSGRTGRGALLALARRSGTLPAMRSQSFRLLASGQFISNVGDGLYAVALPWYVLSHHGGAILLGAVLAAYGIPRTCLILVGGHLADRLSPWAVMMGADIGRLALAGGLAALAAARQPDLLTLAPIAFGLGAGEGLFLPASYAIMPRLVDDDQLQSGNALMSAGTQLATFAGPALGGIVVATLTSAAGFGLDAFSFGISALTLWRLGAVVAARAAARTAPGGAADSPATPPSPVAPSPAEAAALEPATAEDATATADSGAMEQDGLTFRAFLRAEPVVILLMAINVAANLGSAGTGEVALPLFARQHLHAGAGGYGVLIAGFGIGALAGSLAATRLGNVRRPAVVAGLIFLVQVPLVVSVPLAPGLPVAVAMLALWGRPQHVRERHRADRVPALGTAGSHRPAERPAARDELRHVPGVGGSCRVRRSPVRSRRVLRDRRGVAGRHAGLGSEHPELPRLRQACGSRARRGRRPPPRRAARPG